MCRVIYTAGHLPCDATYQIRYSNPSWEGKIFMDRPSLTLVYPGAFASLFKC